MRDWLQDILAGICALVAAFGIIILFAVVAP